jgi:DNA-binding Lrp family transcriptional regulator
MAAIGFVLISTNAGKEREVFEMLERMKDIVELHSLFGEYDIIAKIVTDSPNSLNSIVNAKIRTIPNIAATNTLVGIKF